MGPPPPSRAPGRGGKWVLDYASSTGTQGRNVLFREDIVEVVIRTTVSVADFHPLVSSTGGSQCHQVMTLFSRNSP